MTWQRTIILGDKRRHRRAMGAFGRKLRNVAIVVGLIFYLVAAIGSLDTKTERTQALVDIFRIEHAARLFRADFGRCPTGMDELFQPEVGTPYLEQITDPWGQPYQLDCPARFDPGGVEVTSGGPDREMAGQDNISSL